MPLLPTTEELMKRIESRTGRPLVVEVQTLTGTLLSTSRIARGSDPAHVIRLDPRVQQDADYLVTWECLHVLRLFDIPAEDRFQLSATADGRAEAGRLVATHHKGSNPPIRPDMLSQLANHLYDGLMLQLRSVPIGLRIDAGLRDEYPTLTEQQRRAIVRQLNDGAKVLGPDVTRTVPPKLRRASLAINAAFASFWSRAWNDPTIVVPYRAAGFLVDGETLLHLFDQLSPEPVQDRDLIDAWGKQLGLNGWYRLATAA